ncbi:MAG TPA: hypothetical protein VH143_11945 [Kofleriaceae bacterium]|nr:hypothetical protein [Kofleriaceae bacterium]
MIGRWARRTAELHGELRAIAELGGDPRWWLLAGGAAFAWDSPTTYVMSDAEPSADTFIGHVEPNRPRDPFADAVARALAARAAIRVLGGRLPAQPLAVTVRRTLAGAIAEPSALDTVAFAIGDRAFAATLDGDHRALADDLARVARGREPHLVRALGSPGHATPFLCVTIGDEPLATARHGHRRAWLGNGTGYGPWLGLSHAGDLAVVSTCHMIIDGFGHAWLAEEIRGRVDAFYARLADLSRGIGSPPPTIPAGAVPLAIAWRALDAHSIRPTLAPAIPSALPLGFALGRLLHRAAGRPDAAFSPTFQIPVAPGAHGDPERRRRRVVPAIASVRFDRGEPEPFAVFERRTRELLRREAAGEGLSAHLLAAAQAAPAPLAWKRRAVGASRPGWLDAIATLVGGRGCVSRIKLDIDMSALSIASRAIAPACAVSSPGRLPTATDPLGGCVVTIVDDGRAGAITLCGAGFVDGDARAASLLDALLDALPRT